MLPGLPMVKLGVQVVAGLGVSKILGDIVKNNVAITNTVQKVTVNAGTFVLGSILWEQSSNHVEKMANEVVHWFDQAKNETNTDTEQ